MKRYSKATIETYSGKKKYKWAFNMLFISMGLSFFFGYVCQTILSNMGILMASIVICVFIFLSVVFDMVGVATASADINTFIRWNKQQIRGSTVGLKLCEHSEKVCSFCGDVVGDICSTLCGAAGACIVVTLTHNMINSNIIIIISITSSALIAGITIFFKALMKEYALKNSDKILLKLGIFLEKTLFREKKKKV